MSYYCITIDQGKARLTAFADDLETAKAHCRLNGGNSWTATLNKRTQKLVTVFALTGEAPVSIQYTSDLLDEGVNQAQSQQPNQKNEQTSGPKTASKSKERKQSKTHTKSSQEKPPEQTKDLFEPKPHRQRKEYEQERRSSRQDPPSPVDNRTLEY